jgi:hypothetical protein
MRGGRPGREAGVGTKKRASGLEAACPVRFGEKPSKVYWASDPRSHGSGDRISQERTARLPANLGGDTKRGLTEFLGAFSGFQTLGFREVFEDGGDEIGAIAVFTVRHFIDLADEPFGEADGDLRHAGGTRADFSFLCHFVFWLLDKSLIVIDNRQDFETIKIQLAPLH